jgi:hypothetical protein
MYNEDLLEFYQNSCLEFKCYFISVLCRMRSMNWACMVVVLCQHKASFLYLF